MNKVLPIYKPIGLTPLQLIKQVRVTHPEYKNAIISYAGRLDPLAHGVMLLLIGSENKNRQQYLGLKKEYSFSVLFGIETDSYDYLGFLKDSKIKNPPKNLEKQINLFIKKNTGKLLQSFPPFSSKPINGIPLYKLAKQGTIEEKDLPIHEIEIYDFQLTKIETKNTDQIKEIILPNIQKIPGEFRQKETVKKWKNLFDKNSHQQFTLAHFSINCSTGTYVRSLVNEMGKQFGCGAIAFEILRTKVGDYSVESSDFNS